LTVPFVIALAFSLAVKPFFIDRYFVVILPPIAIAAAAAISRINRVWVFAATLGVVLLLAASQLKAFYASNYYSWKAATAYVMANSKPGDAIAFCPSFESNPYYYYALRYPSSQQLAALEGNAPYDAKLEVFYDIKSVKPLDGTNRLWVVGYSDQASDWASAEQKSTLCGLTPQSNGFHQAADWTQGRIRAQLFQRS
jgi:hypothetical protein